MKREEEWEEGRKEGAQKRHGSENGKKIVTGVIFLMTVFVAWQEGEICLGALQFLSNEDSGDINISGWGEGE